MEPTAAEATTVILGYLYIIGLGIVLCYISGDDTPVI